MTLTADAYRISGEVEIVPAAPALYSVDFSRVLTAQLAPNFAPVRLTRPARPGDSFTLWGTGLGDANPGDLEVTLGGRPLQVLYAGHSAEFRGVDQFNIAIPANATLPETCYARLEMKVRGTPTPQGYVATANGDGPCRHPLNLTTAQLTALDEGLAIPVAEFTIGSFTSFTATVLSLDYTRLAREDTASASIAGQSAGTIALTSTFVPADPPATGQCTLGINGSGVVGGLIFAETPQPSEPVPSLGDKVRLEGPGTSWDLVRPPEQRWFDSLTYTASLPATDPVRWFDELPASVWTAGRYTFSGPGDATLEGFRLNTDIPGPVRFRNPGQLRAVDRTRDLSLAWDTQFMPAADVLDVTLRGTHSGALAVISCRVRALDGTLTIPATQLTQLDAAEVTQTASPVLSVSYLRRAVITSLSRRNADPLPAVVNWNAFASIPLALR